MKFRIIASILIGLAAASTADAQQALDSAKGTSDRPEFPIVFDDSFDDEKSLGSWQLMDSEGWKITTSDKGGVLSQFVKKSEYKPKYRSPFHVALVKDVTVTDFQIDVRVLSTHEDYNHRDACLFFGFQNPNQFYYVHLGKKTDDHANQIFIVNNAARTKISTRTTPGTNWDEQWHHVRITRDTESGAIAVFFDDMTKPVMTATDKTFGWGRIGVGSFDDMADWDDLVLRGKIHDDK